ncbi:1,2-phenylacetyl-CoA epoxidase subunit PaaD [Virgisporangium aliadipatigenens]|uniref:1,2-phenylacetyl-CoA epoxidase subunit PaaD n=1 Tax=Virgisporangium aliadipatigenens TaxID=741659 RepID=UPI001944BA13|nr:1,2-phenylacetyl-CoA epoxidase subunit PaaD [Virgisporangium aliadipatigenens]
MERAVAAVSAVPDPEVPVLTIEELGILRGVDLGPADRLVVTITPTYNGCPAMDAIRADVRAAAAEAGHPDAEVRTVLSPAWTTDWITESGRAKLASAGIAPPPARRGGAVALALSVRCPLCGSPDTTELSRFGSTACKALWRCRGCGEPFDLVKAH